MAADMAIHVFESIDEWDLAVFKHNVLGSKYWNGSLLGSYQSTHPMPTKGWEWSKGTKQSDWDVAYARIAETPNVFVGEVSWLKAALFEDSASFVPDPISAVYDLIGENLPVIDDHFLDLIAKALQLENRTSYSLTHWNEVMAFLELHRGKRVFTVSW